MSYPTLWLGARGKDVSLLQQWLVVAGAPVEIDGIFGRATKAAVIRFQRAAGLAADGVVGSATWAALKTAYDSVPLEARAEAVMQYTTPSGQSYAKIATSMPQVPTPPPEDAGEIRWGYVAAGVGIGAVVLFVVTR